MPSIYIINPSCSSPNYHTSESLIGADGQRAVQIADLAVVTVAALVPEGWSIRVTDEAIEDVDFEHDADFVAITGKVSQRARMYSISAEFRRRGSVVIMGGPFASLNPDDARPHADILVTGEMESQGSTLFRDLAARSWKDRYDFGQADLRDAPIPRWDLYPTLKAQCGAVQTTRGCPFNCEFCDVIQYQGRKQRHKTVAQVMAELDALHAAGFRRVLIVDDNFTVHRRWAREVLTAIIGWNEAHARDPLTFITQTSLDIARDEELLDLCREAGLVSLFVGVETMNEASLRETGKKQNLLMPVLEAIQRVVRRGVGLQAEIIAGFDHDGPEIFEMLHAFFEQSPVPDLMIGALTAPNQTPLYARMQREGRLTAECWDGAGHGFWTNIAPKQMSANDLMEGVRRLSERAYAPANYERRMLNMIAELPDHELKGRRGTGPNLRTGVFMRSMRSASARGPAEAAMVSRVLLAASQKPSSLPMVITYLGRYEQARYFLDNARPVEPALKLAG